MSVPVLGYVIRMFPQVSETFIANEILSLERLGVPLQIYSYRRPVENVRTRVRAARSVRRSRIFPIRSRPTCLSLLRRSSRSRERSRRATAPLFGTSLATSVRDRSLEPWKRLLQAGYLAQLLRRSDVTATARPLRSRLHSCCDAGIDADRTAV